MDNLLNIEHEGVVYNNAKSALAAGADPVKVQWAQEAVNSLPDRDVIRGKIESEAGDVPSLLGTTSDAATIAVLVSACFMASLDESDNWRAFRDKAYAYMKSISGEHDPTEIAQDFLASVGSGDVRFPALEKGIVSVLQEVTKRANAVAQAINPDGSGDV